ncbi:MAG: aminodeoxychorismate synthase component I [Ardenticatenales bacterium]|nr:aminodeoxychorismate synthase component I [Ardenticatenales bacterium]
MAARVMIQVGDGWLLFQRPRRVVVADGVEGVMPALQAIETAVNQNGQYAAGFLAYEAAAAFGLTVYSADQLPGGLPWLWFGLFDAPTRLPRLSPAAAAYQIGPWQPVLTPAAYHAGIGRIKSHIARGQTYQINYTFPLHAPFAGDPYALFVDLAAAQQGEYAAYLDNGEWAICSASPELFFRLDGDRLTSRPMKGSAPRGRTLEEDEANMAWLAQSEKNRAENVMIVDMIRNDMGRIAGTGSVSVPHLFTVERYPTILQMTSTVTATTDAPVTDILAHMFPCASITGAPKVRTMELIRDLEPQPRGVYTGSIGVIAPGRKARFQVAIRTVVVDRSRQQAIYGVGSGVVWDSDAAGEWEECLLKARVLTARRPPFSLLESLLWDERDGYFLLPDHLARLSASAAYFAIPLDLPGIERALMRYAVHLRGRCKVRLLVGAAGESHIMHEPLALMPASETIPIGLSPTSIDSNDVWLYHKTTHRAVYDAARAARPDCDDVLLWNERGELTETTTANIVLELDGVLATPPVTCGLLPGTLRASLLRRDPLTPTPNGLPLQERTLTPADLNRCQAIYLINSVRRWRPARLLS